MGAVTEDAFCLKWNDFHTSLTSSFAELREESDLLDATVVCDGTPMRAHKLVLSACSGVFRQLFRSSSSALGYPQGYTCFENFPFFQILHFCNVIEAFGGFNFNVINILS